MPNEDGWLPNLEPGDYGRIAEHRRQEIAGHPATAWHAKTPNGYGCNLEGHGVLENPNGTITVTPSIRVSVGERELWHGHLVNGEWKPC